MKILLISLILFISGCSFNQSSAIDVLTKENTISFKHMDDEEKVAYYKKLDQINKIDEKVIQANQYSSFSKLANTDEFNKVLILSKKQPVVIYFGFEECSYCQAFMPKINQLALDYNKEIYYYHIDERKDDEGYSDVMSWMGSDTVPFAVLVKGGQIVSQLDHNSTVEEIEVLIKTH